MKVIIYFIFILFFYSCKTNPTYKVTGVILDKNIDSRVMLIDHDEIKGFMDPMVMNFNIHDRVEINKLNVMDSVKFDLVILEGSHYTINFKKVGISNKELSKETDFLSDESDLYKPKKVGEKISNATFTTLTNTRYSLYDSNKDYIVISYIFSRCPMPEMCPALVSKNVNLAEYYKSNDKIEFLLISFDYLFDTVDILNEKYNNFEKNNLKFLSSVNHLNDLMLITKQSDISFGGVEDNNIGHTMRTIIIDKNKRILKIYKGLNWKPSDFKEDLNNLINFNK